MLAARHRLREPAQFAAVTRCRPSLRSSGRFLVVYLARTDPTGTRSPRVGFVVSKALGTAVVRNRTKRRLRAQTAPLLAGVPCGVDVVVRALPAAAGVPSAELREELTRSLRRCVDRLAAGESS